MSGVADKQPNPYQPSLGHVIAVILLVIMIMIGLASGSGAVCLFCGALLIFLIVGELGYSRILAHVVFRLSESEETPANDEGNRGKPDFEPTPVFILFGHHWTSIAGAAPIIGPAIACYHGWLPATLWVVFGGLFAGAVHDFSVLVLSARNGGRSIGDVAGLVISWRARNLFLILIMFLVWIVLAVFMNAIANLFIQYPETVLPVNVEIPISILLGTAIHLLRSRLSTGRLKICVSILSVLAVAVLYGFIFLGVRIEEHYAEWVGTENKDPIFGWALHEGAGTNYVVERQLCRDAVNYRRDATGEPLEATCSFGAKQFWTLYLTLYGVVASLLPVWLLVQPRDFLNSYQLKKCMALLLIGLLVKRPVLDAVALRTDNKESPPIFPMLFTTIACGSVSGFHGLVSSGVTSKQLNRMTDARVVGYSGMLAESALSMLVITVCCSSGYWASKYDNWPVNWGAAFIPGAADLLQALGLGAGAARSIVIVLVVSFAATTLDSGMRIQRVLVTELGRVLKKVTPTLGEILQNTLLSTLISAIPACLLANSRIVDSLWNLFGATNQLVACLSLVTVAIYVLRFHKLDLRFALPFIVPVVWLGFFISWALVSTIGDYLAADSIDWFTTVPTYPSIIISFIIAIFVIAMAAEALWYLCSGKARKDAEIGPDGKIDLSGGVPECCSQCTIQGCC